MTTSCTKTIKSAGKKSIKPSKVVTLDEYEPNIGAPFRVVLVHSVRQTFAASGEVLDTCIPNMAGLLKEVALARSLCERKFSPTDIKFVRKAVGLRANELSALLGVSAEHLSRCENGDRALSVAAEKLLRVIILKRRYDYSGLREKLVHYLERDKISLEVGRKLKDFLTRYNEAISELEKVIFESKIDIVHDADEELCFELSLMSPEDTLANDNRSQEDEGEWQRSRSCLAA